MMRNPKPRRRLLTKLIVIATSTRSLMSCPEAKRPTTSRRIITMHTPMREVMLELILAVANTTFAAKVSLIGL